MMHDVVDARRRLDEKMAEEAGVVNELVANSLISGRDRSRQLDEGAARVLSTLKSVRGRRQAGCLLLQRAHGGFWKRLVGREIVACQATFGVWCDNWPDAKTRTTRTTTASAEQDRRARQGARHVPAVA